MSPQSNSKDPAFDGRYARKQIFCRDPIISWSHRARFKLARDLVTPYAGGRVLDYGCGDGTFLSMIRDLFPTLVGTDYMPETIEDCRRRFASDPRLLFGLTDHVRSDSTHEHSYDVVTCMEVLEHCTQSSTDMVLTDLCRLVTFGGVIIASVPIETGLALVGKQLVRAVAGYRDLGDYKYRENYKFRELLTMVFAGAGRTFERPTYITEVAPGSPVSFHGHKGFNWRALRVRIEKEFCIERTIFSPLRFLGGMVNSQAWFVCRPRAGPRSTFPGLAGHGSSIRRKA